MNRTGILKIWVFGLVLQLALVSASAFGQAGTKGEKEGYVSSITPEGCKACHPQIFGAFQKENPHWPALLDPELPIEKKGCEACHGPGMKHLNAGGQGFIFSFKDKSAKERSDACLKCHEKEKKFFQFGRGTHRLSAVGCNDCHQMHGTRLAQNLLKGKETDLCFSCHQDVKSKFYLPTRHKVLEGAVKCSDCHTPHGTRTRASLRTGSRFNFSMDLCFKCHPEKRGPWVFEHPSVKVEGCSACHVPHGSPNRFLLIRPQVRTVCIECHGQRHFNPISCVNCHTQIHGSNFSSKFFQ